MRATLAFPWLPGREEEKITFFGNIPSFARRYAVSGIFSLSPEMGMWACGGEVSFLLPLSLLFNSRKRELIYSTYVVTTAGKKRLEAKTLNCQKNLLSLQSYFQILGLARWFHRAWDSLFPQKVVDSISKKLLECPLWSIEYFLKARKSLRVDEIKLPGFIIFSPFCWAFPSFPPSFFTILYYVAHNFAPPYKKFNQDNTPLPTIFKDSTEKWNPFQTPNFSEKIIPFPWPFLTLRIIILALQTRLFPLFP